MNMYLFPESTYAKQLNIVRNFDICDNRSERGIFHIVNIEQILYDIIKKN